jgi:hypothetical protein
MSLSGIYFFSTSELWRTGPVNLLLGYRTIHLSTWGILDFSFFERFDAAVLTL